jgi:lipopolysaccharide/colanic/teichoic acid biosynthesis glycosyltransferase
MLDLRDDSGRLVADELRLTNFGQFMRTSSLDGTADTLECVAW